jgi:hypothetical protein
MSSNTTPSAIISSIVLVSILWGILIIYFIASFAGASIFSDMKLITMVIMLVIIVIVSLLT